MKFIVHTELLKVSTEDEDGKAQILIIDSVEREFKISDGKQAATLFVTLTSEIRKFDESSK